MVASRPNLPFCQTAPMRSRAVSRKSILPLLAAVLLPSAAHAQRAAPGSGEAMSLAGRMRAFLEAARAEPAAFFPRRGDWTWVQTHHHERGGVRVGVWRFRAEDTPKALAYCGPAGESFAYQPHGQPLGVFIHHVIERRTRWRRVRGNRFVPPGAPAGSPVFVEWRREDGEWVVSAFGDERFHGPRLLGTVRSMVVRNTPLPAPPEAYATGTRWFMNNEPITFEGRPYRKYGSIRRLEARELTWIGLFGRVRVYAQKEHAAAPEVLYVATGPGEFQPYQAFGRVCP
jgi:hypothetical protein